MSESAEKVKICIELERDQERTMGELVWALTEFNYADQYDFNTDAFIAKGEERKRLISLTGEERKRRTILWFCREKSAFGWHCMGSALW